MSAWQRAEARAKTAPPPSMTTDIEACVRALSQGELVAFPTETVYGLGADAENPLAVRRIFEVKGRPSSHPLIVHVASAQALGELGANLPPLAWRLAEQFWPGPLTLVVERSERVPLAVTGGQNTVGLRVPAHPIALELLRAFGRGVAAPSANRFGRLSPTRASHVREDLGSAISHVLDGGDCEVGVESTIVDLSRGRPRLLRPGGVPREALEQLLQSELVVETSGPVRVSGQLPSHYAPEAELVLCEAQELDARISALHERGARLGLLLTASTAAPATRACVRLPDDASAFAQALYSSLRELDKAAVDVILVVPPASDGMGLAVLDRLTRAAAPRPES
ncbi:MAG: L-threonylcarbamoyladenylate synthase [Hyphomonadaceae bacterium]